MSATVEMPRQLEGAEMTAADSVRDSVKPTEVTSPRFSSTQHPAETIKRTDSVTSVKASPSTVRNTILPSHVEGFIDLETLAKIHNALCLSEAKEDTALAAWTKENYLYEPIGLNENGRPIQSREGFEKLDKAYKRVRMLTNRAQDKWPFFDRTWKRMTATLVRQVAQGEVQSFAFGAETSKSVLHNVRSTTPMNGSATLADLPNDRATALHDESINSTSDRKVVLPARMNQDTEVIANQQEASSKLLPPAPANRSTRVTYGPSGNIVTILKYRIASSSTDSLLSRVHHSPMEETSDSQSPNTHKRKRGRDRASDGTFAVGYGIQRGQRKKQRGGRGSRVAGSYTRLSQPIVAESDDDIMPASFDEKRSRRNIARATPVEVPLTRSPETTSALRSARVSTHVSIGEAEDQTSIAESEKLSGTVPQVRFTSEGPAISLGFDLASSLRSNGVARSSYNDRSLPKFPKEEILDIGVSLASDLQPNDTCFLQESLNPVRKSGSAPSVKTTAGASQPAGTNLARREGNATIEFLARIQSQSGPIEVSVPAAFFKDLDKLTTLVHDFIDWQNGEGAGIPLTFQQFSNIRGMRA